MGLQYTGDQTLGVGTGARFAVNLKAGLYFTVVETEISSESLNAACVPGSLPANTFPPILSTRLWKERSGKIKMNATDSFPPTKRRYSKVKAGFYIRAHLH